LAEIAAICLAPTDSGELAVPVFLKTLKTPNVFAGHNKRSFLSTCYYLWQIGPKSKATLPALKKYLKRRDFELYKIYPASAILRIDPTDKEALVCVKKSIAEIEKECDGPFVLMFINTLGQIGKEARPALPKLQQLMKNEDPR